MIQRRFGVRSLCILDAKSTERKMTPILVSENESGVNLTLDFWESKKPKTCCASTNFRFRLLVAGVGLEPHDLRVMSCRLYLLCIFEYARKCLIYLGFLIAFIEYLCKNGVKFAEIHPIFTPIKLSVFVFCF